MYSALNTENSKNGAAYCCGAGIDDGFIRKDISPEMIHHMIQAIILYFAKYSKTGGGVFCKDENGSALSDSLDAKLQQNLFLLKEPSGIYLYIAFPL